MANAKKTKKIHQRLIELTNEKSLKMLQKNQYLAQAFLNIHLKKFSAFQDQLLNKMPVKCVL